MHNIQSKKSHCKYCFDVLISKLNGNHPPPYPQDLHDPQVPIFVTWKKQGQLRGCIGTFSPSKLSSILSQYAIISSMKDPRFPPMKVDQLPHLSVGVSLLVNFTQSTQIYNWQVGRHGIVIKASYKGRNYSGTFLPEVAKEQEWDQKQTLEYLIKKAGFYGELKHIEPHIKLTTYESSKEFMEYKEYVEIIESN